MKKLFFVNKTPSSDLLTQSEAGEKASILSHVQRNRRKAESKRTKIQPWTQLIYTMDANPPSSETMEKANMDNYDPIDHMQRLVHYYPAFNSSDPFHCTVVGSDADHAFLRSAFASNSRPNFLAEAFAPASICVVQSVMRHNRIITERLKQCIHNETLMYATLAYGSSFVGWTLKNNTENRQSPEYFVGRAIKGVRKQLSLRASPDDWLMLSIYSLAVTELWNGIPEVWKRNQDKYTNITTECQSAMSTCRMHLSAALRIVEQAGGWQHFDPYILDSFILADKFLAICTMAPPLIPLTWEVGPLSTDAHEELKHQQSHFGDGFTNIPMTPHLRIIIHDILSYIQTASAIWLNTGTRYGQESWLFRRLQAVIHRLLQHYHFNPMPLEQCICLTILVSLLNSTCHRGPQIGAIYCARALKALLIDPCVRLDIDTIPTLSTWCLWTGALLVEEGPERQWFVDEALGQAQGLDPEALQYGLERFLFRSERQFGQFYGLVAGMSGL